MRRAAGRGGVRVTDVFWTCTGRTYQTKSRPVRSRQATPDPHLQDLRRGQVHGSCLPGNILHVVGLVKYQHVSLHAYKGGARGHAFHRRTHGGPCHAGEHKGGVQGPCIPPPPFNPQPTH